MSSVNPTHHQPCTTLVLACGRGGAIGHRLFPLASLQPNAGVAANSYEPTTFFFVATIQHTLLSPFLSERNRNPHTHTPALAMDGRMG